MRKLFPQRVSPHRISRRSEKFAISFFLWAHLWLNSVCFSPFFSVIIMYEKAHIYWTRELNRKCQLEDSIWHGEQSILCDFFFFRSFVRRRQFKIVCRIVGGYEFSRLTRIPLLFGRIFCWSQTHPRATRTYNTTIHRVCIIECTCAGYKRHRHRTTMNNVESIESNPIAILA